MKKVSILLVLALLTGMLPTFAGAEASYSESPMLSELVEAGELPPVEERLPEIPQTNEYDYDETEWEYEIGEYGGNAMFATSSVNWDADVFVAMTEGLLTRQSLTHEYYPNLVEAYEVSEDLTTFTFTLRKGLKWSSGVEVTMEDFRFAIEDFVFNEELTPALPAWAQVRGEAMTFTIIDDYHFEIKFPSAFGTFLWDISWHGWKGYSNQLKPAYYLKPFHKDYAEECHGSLEAYYEFIQPFAIIMGYDDAAEEGVWTYVFHQIDCTEWEVTDCNDALTSVYFEGLVEEDFPVLYPWRMVSSNNGITTFERNPYYHKVDTEGNQLPYIDCLQSSFVEDIEMMQMEVAAGNVDFMRESSSLDNISFYRENAETANIDTPIFQSGSINIQLFLNYTYGLDMATGELKDDEESQAWQEVTTDIRFRRAMAICIDAQEVIDAIYSGYGEVRESTGSVHDIDGANDLLDEMGMVDIDGDGYRETPSGRQFSFQIWNADDSTDIIPAIELYCEYFAEIGINVSAYTTEGSILSTTQSINEVPARVIWDEWSMDIGDPQDDLDIAQWAPLYLRWFEAGCPTEPSTDGSYIMPEDPVFIEMLTASYNMPYNSSEYVQNEGYPMLADWVDSFSCMIRPYSWLGTVIVADKDLHNLPHDVTDKVPNYFLENCFFDK